MKRSSGSGFSKVWLLAAACLLLSAGAEWQRWSPTPAAVALSVAPDSARAFTLQQRSSTTIPMPAGVPAAHASALAALPSGELLACWWAGQRESAPDVRLYMARWRDGRWSEPRVMVDRGTL
ncbi:MAG: hypothetical protein H7Y33_08570, partial [Cytophagales bacterium]|nr:hypothetical protein [Rhizobacter sp.]